VLDHDDARSVRQIFLVLNDNLEAAQEIARLQRKPTITGNEAPQKITRRPEKQQRNGSKQNPSPKNKRDKKG